MSLPILSAPKYTYELPFFGRVTYRPYFVREESAILSAIELGDELSTHETLKSVIQACTDEELDYDKLTLPEFLILSVLIRSKSKGSMLNLIYNCQKCKESEPLEVNIEEISNFINTDNRTILTDVDDTIGIEISVLTANDYPYVVKAGKKTSTTDDILMLSAALISKVVYDGKPYDCSNESVKDVYEDVVTKLSKKQYLAYQKDVDKLFQLTVKFKHVCSNCENEVDYNLMDDFDFFR